MNCKHVASSSDSVIGSLLCYQQFFFSSERFMQCRSSTGQWYSNANLSASICYLSVFGGRGFNGLLTATASNERAFGHHS